MPVTSGADGVVLVFDRDKANAEIRAGLVETAKLCLSPLPKWEALVLDDPYELLLAAKRCQRSGACAVALLDNRHGPDPRIPEGMNLAETIRRHAVLGSVCRTVVLTAFPSHHVVTLAREQAKPAALAGEAWSREQPDKYATLLSDLLSPAPDDGRRWPILRGVEGVDEESDLARGEAVWAKNGLSMAFPTGEQQEWKLEAMAYWVDGGYTDKELAEVLPASYGALNDWKKQLRTDLECSPEALSRRLDNLLYELPAWQGRRRPYGDRPVFDSWLHEAWAKQNAPSAANPAFMADEEILAFRCYMTVLEGHPEWFRIATDLKAKHGMRLAMEREATAAAAQEMDRAVDEVADAILRGYRNLKRYADWLPTRAQRS